MASPRRIGAPDAKNRTVLLDATEQLMLEEGYAAVSSRRVASKAGLKPQLVHYYFRTMDDLFVALFRRRAEEGLRRQEEALTSARPLRALWEFHTGAADTGLTMEFVALANHRKTIRSEIAHYAERFRTAQLDILAKVMRRYGIDPDEYPPAAAMFVMTSISRMLVMEQAQGISGGHAETRALVERFLGQLDAVQDTTHTS